MGNSESSSQLPAGADSRRGVVRSRKSEEGNDATPSSVAVRAAVKVGTAVARAVLMAWGACCSANSPRSEEHPIKDDRCRHDMLAAAGGDIRVDEMFGGGRKGIAGGVGGPDLTVTLHGPGLTVAEDRLYQQLAGGEGRGICGEGNSRSGGGDGVGHTTEGGGIGGGGGGGDSGTTEGAGVGGEGGPRRRRQRRARQQRSGAAKEEKKKGTVVKVAVAVAVAQQRGAAKEEKVAEASTRRQRRRMRRQQAVGGENGGNSFPVGNRQKSVPRTIKFMTYNVWKQEGTDLPKRIRKLGHLVEKNSPDVIFFQEVTPNIKRMFQTLAWWNHYDCSDSSENAIEGDFCVVLSKLPIEAKICVSSIGRELPGCELNVGNGRRLFVANAHLKCPNPPGMHCEIRKTQVKEAMKLLNCSRNAVFGGDMNWDEHRDGQFPLPKRWVDAWTRLKPNNNGWTYDTKSNKSLKGRKLLQKRLDRFVCKLRDFTLKDIKIIGNDAEPPSDHYGLLLTICYK